LKPVHDVPTWSACVQRWSLYASCALLVLCMTSGAAAEPELMTDSDLEAVTARGVDTPEGALSDGGPVLDLGGLLGSANADNTGALFGFNMGNVVGGGSAEITGLTQPSTLTLNGALSPSVLNVQTLNYIVNLNICVECKAETIYQQGIALPIEVKLAAPNGQ
jgi:hypothetical protein